MSKAEERSKEIMQAALDYANNLDDIKPTDEFRRNLCAALGQAFMDGAKWADEHQAEKDNELTLEDVEIIINAFLDFCIENKERGKTKRYNDKEYCQEVLKRFKDLRQS